MLEFLESYEIAESVAGGETSLITVVTGAESLSNQLQPALLFFFGLGFNIPGYFIPALCLHK